MTPYQTGTIALAHADERRTIAEFNGNDMSVQSFVVHASRLPLGKHYHAKKRETFVVIVGGGYVLLSRVNKVGKAVNDRGTEVEAVTRVDLEPGSVVVVDPYVAHTFYLEPGSQMFCLSSNPFNPDDMDMLPADWLVNKCLPTDGEFRVAWIDISAADGWHEGPTVYPDADFKSLEAAKDYVLSEKRTSFPIAIFDENGDCVFRCDSKGSGQEVTV